MKKLKLLLVICAVAFLSGCYKFETKMVIGEDGKVDLEVTYGVMSMSTVEGEETLTTTAVPEVTTTAVEEKEEDIAAAPTGEVTTTGTEEVTTIGAEDDDPIVISNEETTSSNNTDCSALQAKLGEGWTVTDYTDGTYTGCTFKKTYASIDEISGDKDLTLELSEISSGDFDDKQLFKKDGKKYTAHFTFNTADDLKDSGTDISSMKDYFKLSYSVELPYKSISNNADKVENGGKKLTWDIEIGKDEDIKYTFTLDGSNPGGIPWLYIGIGAGALVLIIIICLVVTKGKKCECSNCNCEAKEEVKPEPAQVSEPVAQPVVEETPIEEAPVAEPVVEEVSAEPSVEETTEPTENTNNE